MTNLKTSLLGRYCRQTEDSTDLWVIRSVFLTSSSVWTVDRVTVQLERCTAFGKSAGGRLVTCYADDIILQSEPK